MREYHVVEHGGAVAVVPIQDGQITLVKQPRPAVNHTLLEIPAGCLEQGEEPLACAKRELAEETGWRANTWHELGWIYQAPGYSSEVLYLYIATDLSMGEQDLDDSEDIEVVHLPVEEALAMARRCELRDAKTVAALFHLQNWLETHRRARESS